MEATVDINALRNELAREILETEDVEWLEWIREEIDREKAEVINSWIAQSEADIAAGRVLTLEESEARLDRLHAELCR